MLRDEEPDIVQQPISALPSDKIRLHFEMKWNE